MAAKPEALKRLGGGRWQTREGRFTIEPQSGSWVVVDSEQTDDLGLPLVRGPYGSLGAAKEAIEAARTGENPVSPLAERLEASKDRPEGAATRGPARPVVRRGPAGPPKAAPEPSSPVPAAPATGAEAILKPTAPRAPARAPGPPAAPEAPDRPARPAPPRRAPAPAAPPAPPAPPPSVPDVLRERIRAIVGAGAAGRRAADAVLALVLEGQDAESGLRWQLVDGDGQPIVPADAPRSRGR